MRWTRGDKRREAFRGLQKCRTPNKSGLGPLCGEEPTLTLTAESEAVMVIGVNPSREEQE